MRARRPQANRMGGNRNGRMPQGSMSQQDQIQYQTAMMEQARELQMEEDLQEAME